MDILKPTLYFDPSSRAWTVRQNEITTHYEFQVQPREDGTYLLAITTSTLGSYHTSAAPMTATQEQPYDVVRREAVNTLLALLRSTHNIKIVAYDRAANVYTLED